MRTKTIMIVIALLNVASSLSAGKIVRRQLNILQTSVLESKTLASAGMEFVYDYHFNADTIYNSSADDEQMLLQISPEGISKFSSLRNARIDSIIPTMSDEQILQNADKLLNGPMMNIFKNYPAGKLTHTEKIAQDWFRYEEDMPVIEWELGDSVKTVLGYECREANARFRGRDWHVFYTEEIPVMEGPWKLHGLPGLIMSATDRKGDYRFECVGVKQSATRPVCIYDVPYNKTDRKKFYDTLHRYDTNPYGYAETVCGVKITVTDSAGNPDPTAFDPMELNYDYLERDWR